MSIEEIDLGGQEHRRYAVVLVRTVAFRAPMRGEHQGISPDMPQCAEMGEMGILIMRYDGARRYWRLAALNLRLPLQDFDHASYRRWRITVSLHMRLVTLMGFSADGLAHGSCALHVSEAEVAPTPQCWSMRRIIVKRKLRL